MKSPLSRCPFLLCSLTVLMGCLLVMGAGGWPRHAQAQEYFRVSPGPLSASHAAQDHSDGCVSCHVSAEGVTNSKCVACHQGLLHAGGLHASFGGKACIDCHVEHKGRNYSLVNWSHIGGRDAFKHERTGFPLDNEHARQACTKCHVRRLKSGGTSYLGLSRACQSCHSGAHGLTNRELSSKCSTCHQSGKAQRGQRLSAWEAPHQQITGVAFEGKHRELACTRCHVGGNMAGRKPPRTCIDCHPPTHPVTPATQNCASCHSQSASMKSASIDHAEFGFPLTGRHAKASCQRCHQAKGKGQARAAGRGRVRRCGACHAATHPTTGAVANCGACHSPLRPFKGAKIDHARYGLPLRGKHERLSCVRCHKRQKDIGYTEGACTKCHTHRRAHNGQFADKPCASCHVEGGKRSKPFDHNLDSRFPLVGLHSKPEVRNSCKLCHPDGLYRVGTIACRDCHKDQHHGEFGPDCAKCHSPKTKFGEARASDVDHSAFPLEGKHKTTPCRDCHVGGKYDLKTPRCVDCHRKDDVHQGRLGQDCGKCHLPTKGAPKFRHDTMTGFPLRGAHRQVRCAMCHQSGTSANRARSLSEWKGLVSPPLDRGFRASGRRCAACHTNPHRGYVTDDCARCHTTRSFTALTGARARAVLPRSHRGAWRKRHANLPEAGGELVANEQNCAVCHGTPGCRNCHRTEAPRSHTGLWRLRTHGTSASYDAASCRVCHQTAACTQCHRRTRPLNHRGAWPTLHGYAAGGFGTSNCSVCHRRAECLRCHVAR